MGIGGYWLLEVESRSLPFEQQLMKLLRAFVNNRPRLFWLLQMVKKVLRPRVWRNTCAVVRGRVLCAFWYTGDDNLNWGDKINPWFIESLSGKPVVHANDVFNLPGIRIFVCIGSVVGQIPNSGSTFYIWGPGMLQESSLLMDGKRKFLGVRGPKTHHALRRQGWDVDSIEGCYGDPALLLPRLYTPVGKGKEYRLGIIPHYLDKNNPCWTEFKGSGVLFIDVFERELEFIEQVCQCQNIVSTSLHGLICADAYGVPSAWIAVDDRSVDKDFKFVDYYSSLGYHGLTCLRLTSEFQIEDLISRCTIKDVKGLQEQLWRSCPFRKEVD